MTRFGIEQKSTDKDFQCIYGNVRVSILAERIIRVEKDAEKFFEDRPSQFALNRNFEKPKFTAEEKNDELVITTNSVVFYIDKKTLSVEADINGTHIKYNPKHNLGGTARTLDGTYGNVMRRYRDGGKEHFGFVYLRNGVMSSDGLTEYNDSLSVLLNSDGSVSPRRDGTSDKYIFAFGDDYLGGLKKYYELTGFTPLIPKYALGNWWSRYFAYSDKSYLALMDKFAAKETPLTVATIDMDWHIVKNVPKGAACGSAQGRGWTGYTFEKSLFPDHKRFLAELKKRGLAVTMNLHPRDGVRYFEQQYPEMAAANGIDPSSQKTVQFDLTDSKFRDSYFDILHHPYENDGVDFWWIDWQQGTKSKIKGLDPLWLLNHYHYIDSKREGKPGLILSRYAGLGSHRYPLGFSGDTYVRWSSLKMQPWFTAMASNAGYTWWSHDIGGHMSTHGNPEIYLRWLQFGVFSPINRLHSTSSDMSKEPWLYGKECEQLSIEYLRLRHRLLPYLYTANVLTATEGVPLVMPMYYKYKTPEAYKYPNQYLFGSEMFVAPVVKRGGKDGVARQKIWFPEGEWTDVFTGKQYDGNKVYDVATPKEFVPAYIKKGGLLPLLAERDGNSQKYDSLEIRLYFGNNNYTVYDEKGQIDISVKASGDSAVISVKPTLNADFDTIKLVFCDLKGADIIANGKHTGRAAEIIILAKPTEIKLSNIILGGNPPPLIKVK